MSPIRIETGNFQHVIVSGTPYERGYQHGVQASEKIKLSVAQYKTSPALPPQSICAQYIHNLYIPAINRDFPEGLDEMKGIAEGAGVSLSDVVLLNARYDLSRVRHSSEDSASEEECTSMAMVHEHMDDSMEGSRVYVAQNWDMASWLCESDIIIILQIQNDSADDISAPRSIISLTEAGQLGRSGMNSLGMGLCANSLWSSEDKSPYQNVSKNDTGVPYLPFSLVRRMFLECGTMAAGLKAICTTLRHVSGNIVVGASDGLAINVEITPSRFFTSYPERLPQNQDTMLVTHANHFVAPAMVGGSDIRDTYPGGSSLFRDKRLYSLLQKQARYLPTGSKLGPKQIKAAFKDHAGFPRSLCEHKKGVEKYGAAKGDSVTVASVIYDLSQLVMHVCKGNPCCGSWETHSLR